MTRPVRLSKDDVQAELASVPGWSIEGDSIRRRYEFGGFKAAMAFVNRVAALAEGADHHPEILIEYAKVTLTLSTHDVGGLSPRDFALARSIDAS